MLLGVGQKTGGEGPVRTEASWPPRLLPARGWVLEGRTLSPRSSDVSNEWCLALHLRRERKNLLSFRSVQRAEGTFPKRACYSLSFSYNLLVQ